jgi:hypothetical protein
MASIIVRSARIAMPQGNIVNLRVSVDRSLATAGGPAAGVVALEPVSATGFSIDLPEITLYTTWDAPDATTQQAQYTAQLVDGSGNVIASFDYLNPFQLRIPNSETTWKEIEEWNEFYRESKNLTPNDVPGQYDAGPVLIPSCNVFLGTQTNAATDTMGLYAGNADNPPGLRFNVATQLWEFSDDGTTWAAFGTGGGGTPAAPDTSVQFNNSGSFGGSAGFTFNSATNSLSLGTAAAPGGLRLVGITGFYWNIATQNPAANETLYLPDDVTPATGNFLFVSNAASNVVTDWSTGLEWSNSTRTLSINGSANTQLGALLSNTSGLGAAETTIAFTNNAVESAFLSLTGSGFTPSGLQKPSQLYLKGFTGVDEMLFELPSGSIYVWGINATEVMRLNGTTGLLITSPAGADTSGLRFVNLTSASPAGASTAYLAVDGSGNVVRAAAPGGAPVDATYLTLSLNGTLTNERVFRLADTTLTEVDGGAGGDYTIGVNQANAFAWTAVHTWQPSTSQVNAISLNKASLGAVGQRDSDRLLIQAKAHDGVSSYTIESREYINVVSNDGVGSLFTIDGRNTFAGAGFNTLFTLNISSGDGVFTGSVTAAGLVLSAAATITSNSASALAVGANGATNPVLSVNAATASVATGVSITGAAAGSAVTIASTSTNSAEEIYIVPKGNAAVKIGTGGGAGSSDQGLYISRSVDNTNGSGNGHAFVDASSYTRTAGGPNGFNSFDTPVTIGSNTAYDHYVSYQARPNVAANGTWNDLYGAYFVAIIGAGTTITRNTGLWIQQPTMGAGATITNNYGVYVDGASAPGSNNYSLYSNGASYALINVGRVGLGSTTTPTVLLHLRGNATRECLIRFTPNANNSFVGAEWTDNANSAEVASVKLNASTGEFRHFGGLGGYYHTWYTNNTEKARLDSSGNFLVGLIAGGTNAAGIIGLNNGTVPTTYPADAVQLVAQDYAAGDSRLRVYSENGALPVIIGGNAVLSGRQVVAKTANYTVQYTDSNTVFTNSGAAGSVTFTSSGTGSVESFTFEFIRVANHPVVLQLNPGEIVQIGASTTTAGGSVTLDAVGSRLRIVQVGPSLWMGDLTGAATFA